MSDKAEIIQLFTYLKYVYSLSAGFFLITGVFVSVNLSLFFLGILILVLPGHFIFAKLFPYKGRPYKVRRNNVKSYGPPGLLSVWVLVGMFVVGLVAYFLLSKNFFSSFFIAMGLGSAFWAIYTPRHLEKLRQRDEIFIQ